MLEADTKELAALDGKLKKNMIGSETIVAL